MLRRPALTGVVLGLLVVGGCGGSDDGAVLQPRADLAGEAVLAAVNRPGSPAAGGKGAASVDTRPETGAGGRELVSAGDPADDHGDGPGYADLTDVTFSDSGDALTISLTLSGVVPGRLARRELQEVGVEVYRVSPLEMLLGQTDSDYQVRLEGSSYGWRAFLRGGEGYVPFPGPFSVSGRTLRVELPWDAVGGRDRAEVEAFVDWSSGVGRLSTDGVGRVQLRP